MPGSSAHISYIRPLATPRLPVHRARQAHLRRPQALPPPGGRSHQISCTETSLTTTSTAAASATLTRWRTSPPKPTTTTHIATRGRSCTPTSSEPPPWSMRSENKTSNTNTSETARSTRHRTRCAEDVEFFISSVRLRYRLKGEQKYTDDRRTPMGSWCKRRRRDRKPPQNYLIQLPNKSSRMPHVKTAGREILGYKRARANHAPTTDADTR